MSNRNILDTPEQLSELEQRFAARGHDLVFVGGPVRDWLMGVVPKDIDLATSATPDEAIAIYREFGYSYHETGLQHGTITVVLNHIPYEITTYRIDAETDGRHATVVYSRDLTVDQARRDLTMNSVAMSFDGTIHDPFNGVADIENRVVRFVGVAEDRLREDYLRILRWFRFYGRFAVPGQTPDAESIEAIRATRDGLKQISVERIWAEISKIITGPNPHMVMEMIHETGVGEVIGLPVGKNNLMRDAHTRNRSAPALMAVYLGDAVGEIASRWKWSKEETQIAKFIAKHRRTLYPIEIAKRDLVLGKPRHHIVALYTVRAELEEAQTIFDWVIPVFPVTGQDLMNAGMEPGPEMGKLIQRLREAWIASDYTLAREALMRQ